MSFFPRRLIVFSLLSIISFSTAVTGQAIKSKCYPAKEYNTGVQDLYQVYADGNNLFYFEKRNSKEGIKSVFGGVNKKTFRLIKYDKDLKEVFTTEYTEADLGSDYEVFRLAAIGNKIYMIAVQGGKKNALFKYAVIDQLTGKPTLPFKDIATFEEPNSSFRYEYTTQPTIKGDRLCVVQTSILQNQRRYDVAVFGGNEGVHRGNAGTPSDKIYIFNNPDLQVNNAYIYIAAKEYNPGKRKKDDYIFNTAFLLQFSFAGELKQRFVVPDSARVPSSYTYWKIDETANRVTAVWLANAKDLIASIEKVCVGRYRLSDAQPTGFGTINFQQQKLPLPASNLTDKKGNETGEVSYGLAGKTMIMDLVEENNRLYIPVQHAERWEAHHSISGSSNSILDNSTETFSYQGDLVVFCFDDQLKPLWGSKIPRRQRESVYMYDSGNDLYKTAIDLNVTQSLKSTAFAALPLYGGTAYSNNKDRFDFYFNEASENIHKNRNYSNLVEVDDKGFTRSSLYRFSIDKATGESRYQLVSRNNNSQIAMPAKAFRQPDGALLFPSMSEKIKGPLTIIYCRVEP